MEKLLCSGRLSSYFFCFCLLLSVLLLFVSRRVRPHLFVRFPRGRVGVLFLALSLLAVLVWVGFDPASLFLLLLILADLFLMVRIEEVRNASYFLLVLLAVLFAFIFQLFLVSLAQKIIFSILFVILTTLVELFWVYYFITHRLHVLSVSLVTMVFEFLVLKFLALLLFFFSIYFYLSPQFGLSLCALFAFPVYVSFLSLLSISERQIFFNQAVAKRLKDSLVRNFGAVILSGMESDKVGQSIYERLCLYFERERPYLNPDLSVNEVARALFTNKVYLGRAIKHYSNLNFKRFINGYRVRHAQELFKSDRSLRVTQLFLMSGFKNKATFCTAFHLETGENPKEWCDYIRSKYK